MRHHRVIMWVSVVMSVMMILGAAGLYMTQHISILFVCWLNNIQFQWHRKDSCNN